MDTGSAARTSAVSLADTPSYATRAKLLAVIGSSMTRSAASHRRMRLFEHRVEHRREIAGRGIDDLQYLGGRGLLLQCLARLGQEPRVLHRDDRLRREILEQRDLFLGERSDLSRAATIMPRKRIIPAQRHVEDAARAGRDGGPRHGVVDLRQVGDVDNANAAAQRLQDRGVRGRVAPPQPLGEGFGIGRDARRHGAETVAVDKLQTAPMDAAKPCALSPVSRRRPARGRRARN